MMAYKRSAREFRSRQSLIPSIFQLKDYNLLTSHVSISRGHRVSVGFASFS